MLALVSDTPGPHQHGGGGEGGGEAGGHHATLYRILSGRVQNKKRKRKQRKPSQPPKCCITLSRLPFGWSRTGAASLGLERRQRRKSCSPREASSEAANAPRGTGRTANESERNGGETDIKQTVLVPVDFLTCLFLFEERPLTKTRALIIQKLTFDLPPLRLFREKKKQTGGGKITQML